MSLAISKKMSEKMPEQSADILVVGGGMVGGACALGLAQAGYKVLVIEPYPPSNPWSDSKGEAIDSASPPYDLRISAVTADNINFLEALGVWSSIRAMRAHPFYQLAVADSSEQWLELGTASERSGSAPLGYMIENKVLQYALYEQLQAHPSIRLIESPLVELEPAEQRATTQSGIEIGFRWVIGCDGARSMVRSKAGIGVAGRDYGESCVLSIVKTEEQVAARTWERFDETEIHALLPLDNRHACLILYAKTDQVKAWGGQSGADKSNSNRMQTELEHRFLRHVGPFQIENVGHFPLVRQSALAYVRGATVLLGDAAHSIHPMAGQGVNLGFRDVRALLKVFHANTASEQDIARGLKQFTMQRRADNELMAHSMDAIGWGFHSQNMAVTTARRVLLNALRKFSLGKRAMTAYASGVWKL